MTNTSWILVKNEITHNMKVLQAHSYRRRNGKGQDSRKKETLTVILVGFDDTEAMCDVGYCNNSYDFDIYDLDDNGSNNQAAKQFTSPRDGTYTKEKSKEA